MAGAQGVERHIVVEIDLRQSVLGPHGGFRCTERGSAEAMGDGIPVTYVPARNTIFLSFALAWAEVFGGK